MDEASQSPPRPAWPQVFDLHALKAFAPGQARAEDAVQDRPALVGDRLLRARPVHGDAQHPREEEAIFVLEGTANMSIDGEEVVVPAGAIVKFPNAVPHDVRNLGTERCVIMFLKVNPKVLKGGADG